ncbi:signal peptidase II [Chachezhania sediminis]|uniref:signal peptidase II n=1 Tax=Chachezhania sediminis TaxID=2599291 RepID=UPI00131E1642|nr:signal peptidase II [Chachezhania sediminis]
MRLLFWASFWAFLLDQISKYWVIHGLGLSRIRAIDVLPPLLNFRYGENTGINFGLFGDDSDLLRWGLIGFSVLVAVLIWYWALRRERGWASLISAGLLIGGALGNVADRLLYGYVLDFLNVSCCGIDNPFVFNLADVFIFAGAAGVILFEPATPAKPGTGAKGPGQKGAGPKGTGQKGP